MRATPELSVVSPMHCEAEGVDDGSSDHTWAELQRAAAGCPGLRALRFSRNFGKDAALRAGIERARGQAVVTMDADLQHPPALLPKLVAAWRRGGVRVVEAVKEDRGHESLAQRLNSWAFYTLFRNLTGVDLRGASDFKLLDRSAVDAWLTLRERALFYRGTVWWVGFEAAKVEFSVPDRPRGRSSFSLVRLLRLALDAVTAFSSLPLQLATLVGVIFFVVATALGIHTLYMKASGAAMSGFATVILLQLITGSLVLISLGVIGQYLARIYDEVKGRPHYVLCDSVGLMDE